MFERLKPLPPDAIISLIGEYQDDPRDFKVDLGIGVYRTAEGDTPIPESVKRAERMLIETQSTKASRRTSLSGGSPGRRHGAMVNL